MTWYCTNSMCRGTLIEYDEPLPPRRRRFRDAGEIPLKCSKCGIKFCGTPQAYDKCNGYHEDRCPLP